MASLPDTFSGPVHIAIIGGSGFSSLPSPPFTPVAIVPPPQTPWGAPSSPLAILEYQPPAPGSEPITVAFLARHGTHHDTAPHEINNRANIAALKKLGVNCAIGFSAVGSLREEVKPRDFCVAGGVIDWTKGVRPWTFFEKGVVGHVGMAEPFDRQLSGIIHDAINKEGVLQGEGLEVHKDSTIICIEGPQFSTRSESLLYRSFQPPISCIGMTSMPESKLFREAEMAYALVCMATDYDSWHETNEGVSVEMVMGHMAANSSNAKIAVAAILEALSQPEHQEVMNASRWRNASRGGVMGLSRIRDTNPGSDVLARLRWLFGDEWINSGP